MEAAQPGQPAGVPPEAEQAISDLRAAVADVQGRVTSDLDSLRQQLQAAHDAHQDIDLSVVIAEINNITTAVTNIDPAIAAAAPTDVPADQPADAGVSPDPAAGDTPADTGAATGEQGTDAAPADAASGEATGGAGDAWTEGGQAPSQ